MTTTNTLSTISTLQQIRNNRELAKQQQLAMLTCGYSVDLSEVWDFLEDLAHKSKEVWDNKNGGKKQVQNSFNANFAGHAGEFTALSYYQLNHTNVNAPDIVAYMNNQEETSPYDITADDLNVQVKCISKPDSSKYQVTTYNTHKYTQDGTSEICFVFVDKDTKTGYVYGCANPADMLADNCEELNDQGKPAYSAKNVLK